MLLVACSPLMVLVPRKVVFDVTMGNRVLKSPKYTDWPLSFPGQSTAACKCVNVCVCSAVKGRWRREFCLACKTEVTYVHTHTCRYSPSAALVSLIHFNGRTTAYHSPRHSTGITVVTRIWLISSQTFHPITRFDCNKSDKPQTDCRMVILMSALLLFSGSFCSVFPSLCIWFSK